MTAALVTAAAFDARADRVTLTNGQTLTGIIQKGAPPPLPLLNDEKPAEEEGEAQTAPPQPAAPQGESDAVVIELSIGGRLTVPRSDIASIEDVEDPPPEYKDLSKPGAKKGPAKKPPAKPPLKKPPPKKSSGSQPPPPKKG